MKFLCRFIVKDALITCESPGKGTVKTKNILNLITLSSVVSTDNVSVRHIKAPTHHKPRVSLVDFGEILIDVVEIESH